MEFHQLNYFLAIAETQSIAKASQQLHISQSALSVALRDLEREFGFPLFDRMVEDCISITTATTWKNKCAPH